MRVLCVSSEQSGGAVFFFLPKRASIFPFFRCDEWTHSVCIASLQMWYGPTHRFAFLVRMFLLLPLFSFLVCFCITSFLCVLTIKWCPSTHLLSFFFILLGNCVPSSQMKGWKHVPGLRSFCLSSNLHHKGSQPCRMTRWCPGRFWTSQTCKIGNMPLSRSSCFEIVSFISWIRTKKLCTDLAHSHVLRDSHIFPVFQIVPAVWHLIVFSPSKNERRNAQTNRRFHLDRRMCALTHAYAHTTSSFYRGRGQQIGSINLLHKPWPSTSYIRLLWERLAAKRMPLGWMDEFSERRIGCLLGK